MCVLQKLDTEKEIIELVHFDPTEAHELPCRVPRIRPDTSSTLYKHSHEGDYLESVGQSQSLIFCPDHSTLSLSLHSMK